MANNKKDGLFMSFPSHFVSNEEKATMEYGRKINKAIQNEWTAKENSYSRFYNNRYKFHNLRLYAKGDQDVRRYKDEFSLNGDLSYLNLDFSPVAIAPKFVDIVVNGMADRDFSIIATAVDGASVDERKDHFETMRAEMKNKETLMKLSDSTGTNVFENDPEKLPKSQEEFELYTNLEYKQGKEVAVEKAIDFVFKNNRHDTIKYRFDHDLVAIGMGVVKHEFCPNEGIKLRYVDPSDVVYSHTESRFMDDCFYFGEVKQMRITEVAERWPHLTKDELDDILSKGRSWYDSNSIFYNTDVQEDQVVDILFFDYKTVEHDIHKIKDTPEGGKRALPKGYGFNPNKEIQEERSFEKSERYDEVIYQGAAIFGVQNYLLSWEKAKNIVKPGFNSPKALLPYIGVQTKQYKGRIYSLVQRMIKHVDAIQLIKLKIDQVIQRMTPSGIYLDADGLAEIDLGNGTSYNPQEALNMYFQTGSVVGRAITDEGDFNHARIPIQELPGGQGQQIQVLIAAYEYQLQQIRNVTGLNEARDGSVPDPKALVGVQKLAAANSNTATRHILQSSTYLTEALANGVTLRLQDVLEYSPRKDDFIKAIGKFNVDVIDDLKKINIHEFGIFLELGPDEEEKAALEANIQAALAKDLLKPEDAISIRSIKNFKLANQMLKVKREQRDEIEFERQQANIQNQAQANSESARAKAEAEAQAEQIKAQSKIQVVEAEKNKELETIEFEAEKKKELMALEFSFNTQLRNMEMDEAQAVADKKIAADKEIKGFESKGNDSQIGNIGLNQFGPK